MEEVEELKKQLRLAQDILSIVLDKIGEPVVVSLDEAKVSLAADKILDVNLDEDNMSWVIQVVDVV